MGIPKIGKELRGEQFGWLRLENEGDYVVGFYLRSEPTNWNVNRYLILVLDSHEDCYGDKRWILGSKVLDSVLSNLKTRTWIGIECKGFRRSPTTRRRFKDFYIQLYDQDTIEKQYGEQKVKDLLKLEDVPF